MFDVNGTPLTLNGYTRTSFEHSTASLAADASETSVLSVFSGWRAFKVATNRPARIRIYATAAQRLADADRSIGTDPDPEIDHGLLFELVTIDEQLEFTLSPTVDFMSADGSSDFYMVVTNLDDSSGVVTTTFNYVRTE